MTSAPRVVPARPWLVALTALVFLSAWVLAAWAFLALAGLAWAWAVLLGLAAALVFMTLVALAFLALTLARHG